MFRLNKTHLVYYFCLITSVYVKKILVHFICSSPIHFLFEITIICYKVLLFRGTI